MSDSNRGASVALSGVLDNGRPDDLALMVPDAGRTITYRQLADHVGDLAGRLATAGVRRGDRVALALPNGPELVELLLAIATVGAAAAPLNPGYTHDEFLFYLDDLEPAMVLLPSGGVRAGRSAAGSDRPVVDVAESQDGPPVLSAGGKSIDHGQAFESGRADDIALVLHTSGTTSRPKQVPLLQRNLTSSAVTIVSHYHLDGNDVSFCAMPLFHVHGLVASTLATLMSGGLTLIPRRLNPRLFWSQARHHGVTWVSAGPTLHQMLLDKIDDAGAPGALRFVRSCSSALSTSLMQRAEALYQAPMLEAYGMTEASHQIASNPLPPERARRARSESQPAPRSPSQSRRGGCCCPKARRAKSSSRVRV